MTLDTGALIALECRKQLGEARIRAAVTRRLRLTVPMPVIAEWWRGRTDMRERILAVEGFVLEPLSLALAKLAGEAIAAVPGATPIDAIVMASAAQRGDLVYTSDVGDLEALRAFFPAVRILGV